MDDGLFRKKALDKISSPEGLNEYVKAAPFSVWLLLLAIVIFLLGVCAWGIFGRVETVVNGIVSVEDGNAVAYIEEDDSSKVTEGMSVTAGNATYTVASVSKTPIHLTADSEDNGYWLDYLDEGKTEEWITEITLDSDSDTTQEDGLYDATILVESIKPFSFVTN